MNEGPAGLLEQLTREPIPSEMPFPMSEYSERLRKVRKRMADQGMDLEWLSDRLAEEIVHYREHASEIGDFAAGVRS